MAMNNNKTVQKTISDERKEKLKEALKKADEADITGNTQEFQEATMALYTFGSIQDISAADELFSHTTSTQTNTSQNQEYARKKEEALKEAEEAEITGDNQKFWEASMAFYVYGSIQAINTADDLFSGKSSTDSKQSSSAKKALALYKTLSEKEWKQYFGLLDTTRLSQAQSERLKNDLRDSAEKEPYLRRLVRETIQHGKPITFSSTPRDQIALLRKGAAADADLTTRHIRVSPRYIDDSGTIFHEVLHIGQNDDGLGSYSRSLSRESVQKKLKFIEAEAMSISYLCNHYEPRYWEPDYFRKLIKKNENELRENQQDIPAGLTDEEKELFIHSQAVNRTIGASIHILMQPEGEKTQQTAAAYGIELNKYDLQELNQWKKFYNNSHKEWICQNFSAHRVTFPEQEQRVYNYITNRYPVLKGKNFYVTGLTDEEQRAWNIHESVSLYIEEKNYRNAPEKQSLQDHLQNTELNKTNKPEASENETHNTPKIQQQLAQATVNESLSDKTVDTQPKLSATIKSTAQEYEESNKISSIILQEPEKSV